MMAGPSCRSRIIEFITKGSDAEEENKEYNSSGMKDNIPKLSPVALL